MASNPGLHGRDRAKALMNAHEVIKRYIESDSRFQVVQLPAGCIRKPGEAAHVHPRSQIGPLNVACGDVFKLRISVHWDWDCSHNLRGAVPGRCFAFDLAGDPFAGWLGRAPT